MGPEEWKDVVGYEDRYQVSRCGKVRTKGRAVVGSNGWVRYLRPKPRKSYTTRSGYECINLFSDAGRIGTGVHRVVYGTFHGKIFEEKQINHIDGDKKNNHASNLEQVSAKENTKHAYDTGIVSRKVPRIFHWDMVVRVARGESASSVGRLYGISSNSVHKIIQRHPINFI